MSTFRFRKRISFIVSFTRLISLGASRLFGLVGTLLALVLSVQAAPLPPGYGRVQNLSDIPAGLAAAMANMPAEHAAHDPAYAIADNGCSAFHGKAFKS